MGACFQSNVLTFASRNSTIHFDDDSHADIEIPTKTYVAPDGAQWRTSPIPGCACDNGIACGSKANFLEGHAQGRCSFPESKVYAEHGSANAACPHGTMFQAGFDQFTQGYLTTFAGQKGGNKFSVMDEVNVPNVPGEYVLGWRWDCEETDQVWNSCADITITDGPVPPPAPPAPTPPAPTPSPSGACASRHPEKMFDCYYEGCKTGLTGSCSECCDGCHLETDPSKGSFCMEDKTTV